MGDAAVRLMLFVSALLLTVRLTPSARAMDFQAVPFDGGLVLVGIGPIVSGDRIKLVTAMDGVPLEKHTFGLMVNSPGGNVFEAEKLATTIQSSGMAVAVPSGSVCASACFLLFAASPHKLAAQDARVGVHSVSEGSIETLASMGFTTAMARDATSYGVPGSIVGRMVSTPPGQMAWLSAPELASMGTTITPPADASIPQTRFAAPSVPAQPPAPSGPVALAQPGVGMPSLAFQQGAADRRAWEAWAASLLPDARAGVEYWASQRSLKVPGSCLVPVGPPPTDASIWTAGCQAAQARLKASDVRRRTEPDYKAGWNSL